MSEVTITATKQTAMSEPGSKNELKLQRGCDCGQHTPGGHECYDCRKKSARLPRWPTDHPPPDRILRDSGFGIDLSQVWTHAVASPEAQLASATDAPTTTTREAPDTTGGVIPEAAPPEESSQPAAADSAPGSPLIADDTVAELQPGQLRKGDFLNQLRTAVCAEAEAALSGTEHSTTDCPYLVYWFTYYKYQSSDHIENTLRRYAPEARNARSAGDYIPVVAARVRRGVELWARTGEITGAPDDIPTTAAPSGEAAAAWPEDQATGAVQLMARPGGGRPANDPAAVQTRLGSGQPMASDVRSRMEQAFGQSFANVRTHADATGNRLASEQNARAFTVGEHIAFAAGEHRPGTVIGDALFAHELAHVVQQGGASASIAPMRVTGADSSAVEEDADRSAMTVVARLWGGAANTTRSAAPRTRSSLRLARCRQESNGGAPSSLSGLAVTNSNPANTFPVPSSVGASGRQHWVTPERAGGADPVVEANVRTASTGSGPAGLRWEINGTPTTPTGNPHRVSVSRSRGKKVVRAILAGVSSELTLWSVAAQITPSGTPSFKANTTPTRFTADALVDFKASILPVEVITDHDHPDLSGANLTPPPDAGSQICGRSLSSGADHKWDISRRTRQNVINPARLTPTPASDACLWSNVAYPANSAEGNDDTHPGDERNDPYIGGGVLTSSDPPSDFILHADGRDGNTLEIRAQFQEFARLELNRTWWAISEHSPWRFHIKARKNPVNHRWVDDGTATALDNANF